MALEKRGAPAWPYRRWCCRGEQIKRSYRHDWPDILSILTYGELDMQEKSEKRLIGRALSRNNWMVRKLWYQS